MDTFLLKLAGSGVHNVAIVDFGALYPYHVRYLVHKYMNYLGESIKVGVHFHNNQQQAFANSIAAIDEGVDFVDATLHGIGRGAGNCPLELLLFYLDNPKYDPRPILDLVEEFAQLRYKLLWGYHLPYAISGFFNIHPRSAIDGWPALTGTKSARCLRRMPKHEASPMRLTSSWSLLTISAETASRPEDPSHPACPRCR